MKAQFVTAIYTGLEGTRFNGNAGAIFQRYKDSLKSLADGGYNIVCYTSAAHIEELTEHFKDNPNLKLIVEELSENYYHHDIERVKDMHARYTTETSWRSRCVEIMWGKFHWLWEHVSELEKDEHLFWIDAGLFHGGLISNKYRSENSKNFFDFDKITQERDLYADLAKYTDDKILNVKSVIVNHGSDDYCVVYPERPQYGVIGGVFGGKRDQLLEYISGAVLSMQYVLDHDLLLKEEEIMYQLNSRQPEKFTDFMFNSWYHEEWPDMYNPDSSISFSDFFKVLHV